MVNAQLIINTIHRKIRDHSPCSSLYGHMSRIRDINDLVAYPLLKNTHPITFTINAGEAVIIPKKWWHTVESFEDMYGCNIWVNKTLSKVPQKIQHNIKFSFNDLKNEKVQILYSSPSNPTDVEKYITFEEYCKNKNEHEYLWSLENYNVFRKNKHLIKKIQSIIEIPDIIKKTGKFFDFNIMVSSKYYKTHLHYDDEDGLLCVVSGKKIITLFSPEDTPNLYPVKFESYPWKNAPAINGCYNRSVHGNSLPGVSSAELLYETCKGNVSVLSSISKLLFKIYDIKALNTVVWGVKKQSSEYAWELYQYNTPDPITNAFIRSYEVYSERAQHGDYISDFYDQYFLHKSTDTLFEGSIARIQNSEQKERGIWIYDNYIAFRQHYTEYLEKLKFDVNQFLIEVADKYKPREMCIHQKFNNEFYIQYIGISKKEFVDFLEEHSYARTLIDFVITSDYNIPNEITIVYDLTTKKVKRTGFYGFV